MCAHNFSYLYIKDFIRKIFVNLFYQKRREISSLIKWNRFKFFKRNIHYYLL